MKVGSQVIRTSKVRLSMQSRRGARKSMLGLCRMQGPNRGLWCPDLKYHLGMGPSLAE